MLNVLETLFYFMAAIILAGFAVLFIQPLNSFGLGVTCLVLAYAAIFMAYRRIIFI